MGDEETYKIELDEDTYKKLIIISEIVGVTPTKIVENAYMTEYIKIKMENYDGTE